MTDVPEGLVEAVALRMAEDELWVGAWSHAGDSERDIWRFRARAAILAHEAWYDEQPPEEIPALRALLNKKTLWEKP